MMNGRGQTVLGMCCGSCFRPKCRCFSRIPCEKPRFPRYLDVGLTMSVLYHDGETDGAICSSKSKNVLKGIARVDDPFGARWSA